MKTSLRYLPILLVAFLLSGCIFFRLSRVLVQMKEPERYLEVDLEAERFDATLVHPVVLLGDVEFLLSKTASTMGDDHKAFIFAKNGPSDRLPWKFEVKLDGRERITAFLLPPRLSSVLGNAFIMRGIEAVGRAEVSIGKRTVYMTMKESLSKEQVLQLFGAPEGEEGGFLRYSFGSGEGALKVHFELLDSGRAKAMLMSSGRNHLDMKFGVSGH